MSELRNTIAEIYRLAIEDFYEQGLSIAALANKYHKSTSTIAKQLQIYKKSNPDRPRKKMPVDPRKFNDERPLTIEFTRIGLYVNRYITEHGLRNTAFGNVAGFSAVSVAHIIKGTYDLTFLDIQRLAKVLGMSWEELLIIDPKRAAA